MNGLVIFASTDQVVIFDRSQIQKVSRLVRRDDGAIVIHVCTSHGEEEINPNLVGKMTLDDAIRYAAEMFDDLSGPGAKWTTFDTAHNKRQEIAANVRWTFLPATGKWARNVEQPDGA